MSAIDASRDAGGQPSLIPAVGTTISPDGAQMTVFLCRSQSRQVLLDLATYGQVAISFDAPFVRAMLGFELDDLVSATASCAWTPRCACPK